MKTEIFSIGYGNRRVEEFVWILKKFDIALVADVRSIPYSKNRPSYNSKKLASFLNENGIDYSFMGNQLGGKPKDPSFYIEGVLSNSLIWESERFKEGINTLINRVDEYKRVCIMCAELRPEQCHRKWMVGDYLISAYGFFIRHINAVGE